MRRTCSKTQRRRTDRTPLRLALGLLAALLLAGAGLRAAEEFSTDPTLHNGKKWRVGYFVSCTNCWPTYPKFTAGCVNGLMEMGWIEQEPVPDPADPRDTHEMWRWMANQTKSKYLDFVEDAYIDASQPEGKAAIDKRAKGPDRDLDVILSIGTTASKYMKDGDFHVPIVAMSISNPLQAGIIDSVTDSGNDFIHARVDPLRYQRQVQIFYDIIGFKKLGIVVEDSEKGHTFAATEDVQAVAKELGFEVVMRFFPPVGDEVTEAVAQEKMIAQYADLADEVDAVYITLHRLVKGDAITKIMEYMVKNKIPTFSMRGSEEVQAGVLMSIARASFNDVGMFHAENMARMLNGASARKLSLVFEEPPKIAINLEAGRLIGYNPPFEILTVADEIYQEITPP